MQNSNAYEIHLPETVSTIPGRGDFADPNGQPRPLTHYFLEAAGERSAGIRIAARALLGGYNDNLERADRPGGRTPGGRLPGSSWDQVCSSLDYAGD
jgi:hypothetical protein